MANVNGKATHAGTLAPESAAGKTHRAAALGNSQAATLQTSTPAAGLVRPPAAAQTEASGLSSSPQACAAACTIPARPASVLDRILAQQSFAQEPLLPTPTNINPIHLPADDLLHFIAVQQWVQSNFSIQLPLLNGVFVLVQSAALQQAVPAQLQAACASSAPSNSSSASAQAAALCACIPWRLRQVAAVQVPAGVDPADTTLLLVGGDRVSAAAVRAGLLDEVQEYQYLCCEVAHMQQAGVVCQLQVLDVAHMAWRLQVACELAAAKEAHDEEMSQQPPSAGTIHASAHAGSAALESARNVLKQLPPQDWVAGQILQYVELNPFTGPVPPGQQPQPLSTDQYSQLLQDGAAAWQYYVQQKLAGQQPRPVIDLVPWRVLEDSGEQLVEKEMHLGAAADGVAAAQQLGPAGAAPPAAAGVGSTAAKVQQAAVHIYSASGGSGAAAADAAAAAATATAKGVDSRQLLQQQQQQQLQLSPAEEGNQTVSPHISPTPVAGTLHKPSSSACPGTDTQSPRAPRRRGRSSSRSRSLSCSTGSTSSSRNSRSRSSSRRRSQSHSRGPSHSKQPSTAHAASSQGHPGSEGRRDTSSRHKQGPGDPRELLELETRGWLRALAQLLSQQRQNRAGPPAMELAALRLTLPLPTGLHHHYRSISSMVDARPELGWLKDGRDDCVYIKPEYVPALLQGAQDEWGASRQRSRSRSRGRSRRRSRSQDRQKSPPRRHRSRDRSSPAAAPGRGPIDPRSKGPRVVKGFPSAQVQRVVQGWMEELALLLEPGRPGANRPDTIHVSDLRFRLPIPVCVIDHYVSVSRFIKLTPGVKYIGAGGFVGLEPGAHERLRAAAVAHGRALRR